MRGRRSGSTWAQVRGLERTGSFEGRPRILTLLMAAPFKLGPKRGHDICS
jgi:hypothetical protein